MFLHSHVCSLLQTVKTEIAVHFINTRNVLHLLQVDCFLKQLEQCVPCTYVSLHSGFVATPVISCLFKYELTL